MSINQPELLSMAHHLSLPDYEPVAPLDIINSSTHEKSRAKNRIPGGLTTINENPYQPSTPHHLT